MNNLLQDSLKNLQQVASGLNKSFKSINQALNGAEVPEELKPKIKEIRSAMKGGDIKKLEKLKAELLLYKK